MGITRTGSVSPSLLTATVTLTNAQIIAWQAADITLTDVPGAGFYCLPWRVVLAFDTVAAGYTAIDADAIIGVQTADKTKDLMLYLLNGNGTGRTDVSQLLGTTAAKPAAVLNPWGDNGQAFTDGWGSIPEVWNVAAMENEPLVATLDNGGATLTGGNGANNGIIRVYYTIEALP